MNPSDIFAKAWPTGLPPEEQAEWSSVPKDRRESVLRRLSALAALEAGEVNVGRAAALAGLSRQAFHKLRARWGNERSIRSLTPYRFREGRRGDSKSVASIDQTELGSTDPFLAAALEQITKHPSETNGSLGRRLRGSLDERISQPTAVELVRQARRLVALDPDLLNVTYGRSLLIDFIGLWIDGVVVADAQVPVAAIVLERASGIVLGFAVGEREAMQALQIDSIREAIDSISQHQIDIPAHRSVGCRIILPDPKRHEDNEPRAQRLYALLDADRVYARGMRRFGVRTTSILGHKIKRIRLSSRIGEGETGQAFRPQNGKSKGPQLNLAEFTSLARAEIERYNQPLLTRVQSMPGGPTLTKKGGMTSTLQSILEVLQTH